MTRLPWKPGLLRACIGPYFISATRFTCRNAGDHLRVLLHSLRLRAVWPRIADSVGLSAIADFRTRSVYTLSVWISYQDLQQWVRGAQHATLLNAYRGRLADTAYEGWTTSAFDLDISWQRALLRLHP